MLTKDELEALRIAIPLDPDRTRLLETLRARAAPLLQALPPVPRVKALLSRDGGICPEDGAPLRFDPWSAERHICTRCGKSWSGERHHRQWARPQHLWLAERTADLALLAAVADAPGAAERAVELLGIYEDLYLELPNRDNVLGPTHLFFSTYLESLWMTSYIAAAFLLRESGLLPEERIEGVNRVADEAAALIGEFNEGLSNRQTWHAAALTAIAAWFGDAELAQSAVESRTGLLGHLADGFGEDGLWWEGENYHLFALRGLMQGLHWARTTGVDLLEDSAPRLHFRSALLAPSGSALPDFTFPARRDSRYGVSLAQPGYLELWEIGRAWLGPDEAVDAWLGALYKVPAPAAEHYDAWLHDTGRLRPPQRTRGDLSWWALTAMGPAPETESGWVAKSTLLAAQGLAVLRPGHSYASLECGPVVGGHGHPDRLHLTLFADGEAWLPDQGTGSYVVPLLAWYRSALAHNAPRLDGVNAGGTDAWCEAFDVADEWAWCRGRAGEVKRTLVAGPTHLVDVLELEAGESRRLDLPWHLQGEWRVESPGSWESTVLEHPFVSGAERFFPAGGGPIVFEARQPGRDARLRMMLLVPGGELLRATAPGLPTTDEQRTFVVVRADTNLARWVTVLDWSPEESERAIRSARAEAGVVEVDTPAGRISYRFGAPGVSIETGGRSIGLGGLRSAPAKRRPFFDERPVVHAEAVAPRIGDPPALDGTLDGFDTRIPLLLDREDQYRRSEEPYDPERFAAQAFVNWDGEALYLGVAVTKPEVLVREADAPPLDLDNEPEDLHSDGLQVYLRHEQDVAGVVVIPSEDGGVRVRPIEAMGAERPAVTGAWARTDDGYLVTLRIEDPRLRLLGPGVRIGFDLLINEMQPERLRRAGQLIWSGGNGWIYLRGDYHDPSQFGVLELG